MRRAIAGVALVLQGLAHALPGMQIEAGAVAGPLAALGADLVTSSALRWTVAVLWAVAMAGFVAAGAGLLGVRVFRRPARRLATAAALASLLMLGLFWLGVWALPGIAADAGVLAVSWLRSPRAASSTTPAPALTRPRPRSGRLRRILSVAGEGVAIAFVAWLALCALAYPWHTRWGSTTAELRAALPGDKPLQGPPTYWVQHAITIHVPTSEVWPWLAQLGTDRGGFYSHAWLENLFGVPVRNADRIHPEWQEVRTGGFVQATPPGYLGLDRPIGWKLGLVEPGHVMVLETWGAFVLVAVDSATTRFIVRTRGDNPPGPAGLAMAWFGLVAFEPAHFIMERGMLRGVKARAEVARQESGADPRI